MWNWLKEELTFKRLSLQLDDASVLTASAVSIYEYYGSITVHNNSAINTGQLFLALFQIYKTTLVTV